MSKESEMTLEERIKKSREVFNEFFCSRGKFYNKNPKYLNLEDKKYVVGIFYKDQGINGVSLNNVSCNQMVAIFYNVFKESGKMVSKYGENESERRILENIKAIKNLSGQRDEMTERLSIMLEDKIATNAALKLNWVLEKIYPYDSSCDNVPF